MKPSERAKAIRKKTRLSQQKFGDLYGIPKRTIQNWENEVSEPPEYILSLLERIVDEDFQK